MKRKTVLRSVLGLILAAGVLAPWAGAIAQGGGFVESFEGPALDGWELSQGASLADGVLHLPSGEFALRAGEWDDFTLRVRARLSESGALAISFRAAEGGAYHLVVSIDRLLLQRERSGGVEDLAEVRGDTPWGGWAEYNISVEAGEIQAGFFDETMLTFIDPEPLRAGGIGFETLDGLSAELDEVSLTPLGAPPTQGAAPPTAAPPTAPLDTLSTARPEAPAGIAGRVYQSLPWVFTGGPPGGLGYDIRMDPRDPDVMYVTDALAGAFKSLDGGESWFPINNGITTRGGAYGTAIPVFSLTVDPNNPDRLWLGTQFKSEVYRSDDGGARWSPMNEGITEWGLSIRGFTVQSGNSQVVYFAAEVSSHEWNNEQPRDCFGLDATMGVVYKSTDAGEHWRRVWRGDNLARYVWIHPQDPNLVYVSTGIFDRCAANADPEANRTGGVGVLRSRDGGETWEVLGVEHGFDPGDLYIGSLFMHPEDPNILLAGAGNGIFPPEPGRSIGGVYLTEDGGDTWQEKVDGLDFSAVEICEGDPQVAYAGALSGFYRSSDGGQTWTEVAGGNWGPPDIVAGFPIDMQCDPRDPMRLFVNNYNGGNFLTEDGGETWRNASQGYSGAMMTQIALVGSDPAHVYTSARGGLFATDDGGGTWRGMGYGVARTLEGIAIAVDPYDPQHILGTLADAGPFPKVSWDGGHTWAGIEPEILVGGELGALSVIHFAPATRDLVLGATGEYGCYANLICPPDSGGGVIRSVDGGETWQQTSLKSGSAMALAPYPDDDSQWLAFLHPGGLYHSGDYGESWDLVNAHPLPPGLTPGEGPAAERPLVVSLAVDPLDADHIFAGYSQGGLGASTDGGRSWETAAAGLPAEARVMDIAFDLTAPSIMYLAVPGSGVFLSADGGETWSPLNDGLSNPAAEKLALSSDGSVLYVTTEGAGVYRLGTPVRSELAQGETPVVGETPLAPSPTEVPPSEAPRGSIPCLGAAPMLALAGLAWAGRRRK